MCVCGKRQATGRQPRRRALNRLSLGGRPSGASSGRSACFVIRRPVQNASSVADLGFCDTHVCTLHEGAALRKSPGAVVECFSDVCVPEPSQWSVVLSDHVCAAMTRMCFDARVCLLQMPGNWMSAAAQGSHCVSPIHLLAQAGSRRSACVAIRRPTQTRQPRLTQAAWFLQHTCVYSQ